MAQKRFNKLRSFVREVSNERKAEKQGKLARTPWKVSELHHDEQEKGKKRLRLEDFAAKHFNFMRGMFKKESSIVRLLNHKSDLIHSPLLQVFLNRLLFHSPLFFFGGEIERKCLIVE